MNLTDPLHGMESFRTKTVNRSVRVGIGINMKKRRSKYNLKESGSQYKKQLNKIT